MPNPVRLLLFALLLLAGFPSPSSAEPSESVRVGMGFAIAPYVLRAENSGLEVDVIREAFKAAGVSVEFSFLPNLRLPIAFAERDVDCLALSVGYDLEKVAGRRVYGSKPTIAFRNHVVSLASRHLRFDSLEDLKGLVVLGFQDACNYLGPEFADYARGNDLYSELSDQALQVRMLFSGRVDAVISERRVFLYWRDRLESTPVARAVDLDQDVVMAPLFPEQARQVVFGTPSLCQRFDQGLAAIRASGLYDEILKRYDTAEYGGAH
ncbi:transporter substrate-binding domain-containing protein [Pseudodesulfovibrio indicus]|uniref:substrate-binding periplasmic protein n=1 Tax=Pseudodesulfovibrio indicus TaxID=1716143 RepID=UPI00292E9438|nr:transporter substrate-binding domain-containing protein [Pseudodesulfovibrio indicus]